MELNQRNSSQKFQLRMISICDRMFKEEMSGTKQSANFKSKISHLAKMIECLRRRA